MNKKIKQKRLEVFEDMCSHFNSNNRSKTYSPDSPNTEGCAIGRLVGLKISNKLDNLTKQVDNFKIEVSEGEKKMLELLPKNVSKLGKEFLIQFQSFHDCDLYWNANGLSQWGVIRKEEIINEFCK